MKVGYSRVSTQDQNPQAQYDALIAAGCEQIFVDRASGKLASRPELDRAFAVASRPGDLIVVTKLDRLGRSLDHLIRLASELDANGVGLVVLDQGIDTSTAAGRMFFHIIGAVAEFEASLLSERTKEGLAAAKRRGRTGGRPAKLSTQQLSAARAMYNETDTTGRALHTVEEVAQAFGVSRTTIYRHLTR